MKNKSLKMVFFGGLVLLSKSSILRLKGIFLNFLQPPEALPLNKPEVRGRIILQQGDQEQVSLCF